MKAKRIRQILLGICTLLWILFIFSNSMKSGAESGADSSSVTNWLNDSVGSIFPSFHITGLFVRKTAHFLEFSILSLLFSLDLSLFFSLNRSASLGKRCLLLLAIPASAAVATADEIIQCFSPDRGPSVTDVLLDTAGASCACLIFFGILCLLSAKRSKS